MRSPEENAGIFSILTFSWLNPMLFKGYKEALSEEDLFPMLSHEKSECIAEKFQDSWESPKSGSGYQKLSPPSLTRSLAKAFAAPFYTAAVFKFIQDILSFIGPLLLPRILSFLKSKQPIQNGIYLVLGLFFGAILQSLLLHQYFHRCFRVGMQVRAAVVTAVYQKSLRGRLGKGEIVTLMSVDSQRLQDLLPYLHMVWSAPFQIAISMYLLWNQIGIASLAGLAAMLLLIPFNAFLATKLKKFQSVLMEIKDERIKLTNESFTSIKVIKLYAWELSFAKKIGTVRDSELKALRSYVILYAIQTIFWVASPILIAVSSFLAFSLLSDDQLTASKAFTTLALFNLLQFPVSFLPYVVNNLVEASVSIKRIKKYLTSSEIEQIPPQSEDTPFPIRLQDASFTWDESHYYPALTDATLSVSRGELVMVAGRTASGKSALVSALLGEIDQIKGKRLIERSVAYTSQVPWIQNASVKDNIIFGKEFNQEWLDRVLHVCALEPDLDILPAGIETEVGERGINLSGGQKHRIALARAVYQDASIYLLDDPLSAVDSHVSKHIFDNCIKNVLLGKTVVLVTNAVNLLPFADRVLFLQNGKIIADGTFSDIVQSNESFKKYIDSLSEDIESSSAPVKQSSTVTTKPTYTKKANGQLMQQEHREIGKVSLQVYLKYAMACGGYSLAFLTIFLLFLSSAGDFIMNRWLAFWSEHPDTHPELFFVAVYGGIGGVIVVVRFMATLIFALGSIRAARTLHETLLTSLFNAPMSFFDTTPLGRILNRFSKDQYIIDEKLFYAILSYLRTVISVIAIVFAISYATPYFLIMLIPLGFIYQRIQVFYISNSRELKRLDSIRRSPVFSHFSETLQGVSVIRAFKATGRFTRTNERYLDASLEAYYPYVASNRWLALRNEFIGACVVASAAFLTVITRKSVSPALAGLSISYALSITQTLNWMVRMTSERETNIVSVERNIEFSNVPQEAEKRVDSNRPRESWPEMGRVEISHLKMRYRPGLDWVIKDLSCVIESGQTVGVVGRTGAGKSSLLLVLLRLVEYQEGTICIDGVDIKTIGLHDLRSKVSIIPQDPVLFTGTVQFNLDPFEEHSELRLKKVLELANLNLSLSEHISEGGSNLSVGQRQLLCMARALLRNSKLILMDEATSSVSRDIEMLIQTTIKEQFKGCTLIIIAHRLQTVLDSDCIIVMADGGILEMGPPNALLQDSSSEFSSLVKSMEMGLEGEE